MATAATHGQREFTDTEARQGWRASTAESLGLGKEIPRDPAKLLAWAGRPVKAAENMANVLASDPNMKKPPKGKMK